MRSFVLLTLVSLFSFVGFSQVNIGLGPFPDLCENDGTYNLTSGTPAGGIYSGTGVIGNIFNPAANGAGSFPITYSYTDTSGTYDTTLNILVNAAPIVSMSSFPTVCDGDNPVGLNQGTPFGGVYKGSGVIFNTIFIPDSVGVGLYGITYVFTDPSTGCSDSTTQNITVNPSPNVNLVSFSPFCDDQQPITLVGGTPNGGIYIVNGTDTVTSFDPQVFGPDTHEISYIFTDGIGCSSFAMQDLIVNGVPDTPFVFPFSVDTLLCSEPGDSFEWFKNDSIVPQTTRKISVADQNGIFKVRVTRDGCISEVSNPYTYGDPFSVNEVNRYLDISVYPNPSNNSFNVQLRNDKPVSLKIFDLAGKLVYTHTIMGQHEIANGILKQGTYIMELSNNKGTATKKLIKY